MFPVMWTVMLSMTKMSPHLRVPCLMRYPTEVTKTEAPVHLSMTRYLTLHFTPFLTVQVARMFQQFLLLAFIP